MEATVTPIRHINEFQIVSSMLIVKNEPVIFLLVYCFYQVLVLELRMDFTFLKDGKKKTKKEEYSIGAICGTQSLRYLLSCP